MTGKYKLLDVISAVNQQVYLRDWCCIQQPNKSDWNQKPTDNL